MRRLVGEDEAAGCHEHAAHTLAEGRLDSLHLVRRLTPDLTDRLLHREHAVHAGVRVG